MNPPRKKPSLKRWVRQISGEEMPIFGQTVQRIISVAEDDEASTAELARVVLEDAALTARTLKLANTIFYNPRGQRISTVSRATILLGFDTVRNMCLTIALVDAFVREGAPRERLYKELARSIHAAVQARALAVARGDDSPEEVFIAALLYHLGNLAFWCFAGESGEALHALLANPAYSAAEAEEEVLGFRLRDLTLSLSREWRLNELLNQTLNRPEGAGARGRTILLGHELAEVAEKGWTHPEVKRVVEEIGKFTDMKPDDVTKLVHGNAPESARIASYLGSSAASRCIPLPQEYAHERAEAPEAPPEFPQPDGTLQLRILRELSGLIDERADFNMILELVLEGIYRGIGSDRTLFALLTPDRKGLRAKFVFGHDRELLTQSFQFTRHPQIPNVLFEAVEQQRPFWVDTRREPRIAERMPRTIAEAVGRAPFFVAPLVIAGRSIGLFYADRGPSGRALDEEGYESFRHFVQQANMGLSYLAKK